MNRNENARVWAASSLLKLSSWKIAEELRKARRGPGGSEKIRQAQKRSEMFTETQKGSETLRDAQRGSETLREVQKGLKTLRKAPSGSGMLGDFQRSPERFAEA